MVKDVQVVFGKRPGSQPISNDANGHAPMWKKSIFLGATLLASPRGPQRDRRDAHDEESLCEPARLHGCIWKG
jgi:hypothetical protein